MTNVKLEERYLNEWITYHAHLGVDHFYLYDNNDDEKLIYTALDDSQYVGPRIFVGIRPQRQEKAINHVHTRR